MLAVVVSVLIGVIILFPVFASSSLPCVIPSPISESEIIALYLQKIQIPFIPFSLEYGMQK